MRDQRGHFQRHMGRCQGNSQPLCGQHHDHGGNSGKHLQNSVCPLKATPASLIMPLCTGPVTMAENSLRMQPTTARRKESSTYWALLLSARPGETRDDAWQSAGRSPHPHQNTPGTDHPCTIDIDRKPGFLRSHGKHVRIANENQIVLRCSLRQL